VPYLLDTNWVIDYLAGEEGAGELIDNLVAEGIGISLITYMEV
jgi:predicted nucleic acid-binding protein